MPSPVQCEVALAPHPQNGRSPVRGIAAHIWREQAGTLRVRYSIAGEIAALRLPPLGPPRLGRELWKHTCCECFITTKHEPAYYEFNFSPSGEWAVYAFSSYRRGTPLRGDIPPPTLAVRKDREFVELDATIPLAPLSSDYPRNRLALALCAVIEDREGALSHWALRHPAGKPDFHHRDSFALEL